MYNNTKNHKLTPISKVLRKNMTDEEKHLWYDFFKKLPITVHRQKVIGKYVADFYIAEAKIVIELDGRQHLRPQNAEADRERDAYLENLGIMVLRYKNRQISNYFESVCNDILKHIETRTGLHFDNIRRI